VRLDEFLARLENLRKSGRGWSARCPAHVDRSNSLSVALGDDGRLLVHCFAGCTVAEIVGAMGLHITDLFPDAPPRARPSRPWRSQIQEARAQILRDARQQPWACEGTQLLYGLSDWIRLTRRKVIELRRFATGLGNPDDVQVCEEILETAAKLETFVNAVEAELDDILSTGRIE
jgi:hypothetical protein